MGGMNLFEYAPNTTSWIDPLGVNKKQAKINLLKQIKIKMMVVIPLA
jgi:hypothetical protein